MKVYIVEYGCYSDRYVSSVFSTRELAEADIKLKTIPGDTWGGGDITEMLIDEQAGDVQRVAYLADIDLQTGEIFREHEHMCYVTFF